VCAAVGLHAQCQADKGVGSESGGSSQHDSEDVKTHYICVRELLRGCGIIGNRAWAGDGNEMENRRRDGLHGGTTG